MKRLTHLLCLAFLSLSGADASAAPITFQFDTTMDTSAFGGGPGVPLTVVYTFDSELPQGSGPWSEIPGTSGSYGPLAMQIQLGNETVSASGGGITIWGNHIDDGDLYDVRPSVDENSSFSGQLLGRDIYFFRFLLVDVDENMFGSTALPLSPAFAVAADFQQTGFDFEDGTHLAVNEAPFTPLEARTPFTLAIVPEPSTLALAAVGVLGLMAWRKRRRSICAATSPTRP